MREREKERERERERERLHAYMCDMCNPNEGARVFTVMLQSSSNTVTCTFGAV